VTVAPGWRIPRREELFPIDPQQRCIICGSEDWRFVYLLLNAPEWVQRLSWVVNWFVVMCGPCHAAFESGDDTALDSTAEFLEVLRARVSEPPLSREAAQLPS
jgi:hypothetical protein